MPDMATISPEVAVGVRPEWMPVKELRHHPLDQIKLGQLLGSTAVSETVAVVESESRFPDLLSAIKAAAAGDAEARKMLGINARTDYVERYMKAGIVLKVPLTNGESGKFSQYSQSMNDVHRNAYRYMEGDRLMMGRTRAEALNTLSAESANEEGLLENNSFLVFSVVPDEVSVEAAGARNFFTSTMSLTVQLLQKNDKGEFILESAFVAGVLQEDDERHDLEAIAKLTADFGVNLWGATATEILGSPQLIDNDLIPNGVVDIVQMLDEKISDIHGGKPVFFGQDKLPQDYATFSKWSEEKIAEADGVVDEVVAELIKRAPELKTPEEARDLLDRLNHQKLLERSSYDASIDPTIFGEPAAELIVQARKLRSLGEHHLAEQAMFKAFSVAKDSSSCPSALREALRNQEGSDIADAEQYTGGSTMYCVKCPKCREPHDEVKKQSDGKYYCKNPDCELAHPTAKASKNSSLAREPRRDFAAEIRKALITFPKLKEKNGTEQKSTDGSLARTPALN